MNFRHERKRRKHTYDQAALMDQKDKYRHGVDCFIEATNGVK